MQPADLANAVFETAGGFFMYLNIRRLLRDKLVRGVDWRTMAFFTSWGYWNLFYYPHLGQWFSFAAGTGIVIINMVYFILMIYYIKKETAG